MLDLSHKLAFLPTVSIPELLSVIHNAGNAILKASNAPCQKVEIKKDNSPVTNADLESHEILVTQLKRLSPNIPIISEESFSPPFMHSDQRYWLIDPLDGTKEFINGKKEYCTILTFMEFGRPLLGLIHSPVTNVTYLAIKGLGAFRYKNHNWKMIKTRPVSFPPVIVTSKSHKTSAEEIISRTWPNGKLKKIGSALKLCEIAEGKADLHLRMRHLNSWDIAAADCLIQESGGWFSDLNARDILYDTEDLKAPHYFVAGDREFAKKTLECEGFIQSTRSGVASGT